MKTIRTVTIWIAVLTVTGSSLLAAEPSGGNATNQPAPLGAKNAVVFAESGSFAGWPANAGAWTWDGGKEILVGFTKGPFVEKEGHNIGPKDRKVLLARSTDGGTTWSTKESSNLVGNSAQPVVPPGEINFEAPGFAMRVMGTGYHGHPFSSYEGGAFFVSEDKGKNWQGPYGFNGLMEDPNLAGTECTSRTGYLVTGPQSCLVFMSARPIDKDKANAPQFIDYWDKSYVAETTDGGKSFHFVSWIAPLNSKNRAVMPAVCRLKDGSIVATVRANRVERDAEGEGYMAGHVDAYGSTDNGKTW
ncbi:MAG: sialidase family protein, partial [Akkermansiaceae bacterium]